MKSLKILFGFNFIWGILFSLLMFQIIGCERGCDGSLNSPYHKETYLEKTKDSEFNYHVGYFYFSGYDTGIYNRWNGMGLFLYDIITLVITLGWGCLLYLGFKKAKGYWLWLILCTVISLYGMYYTYLYFTNKAIHKAVIG
jgi:hypothetical protein